MNEEKGEVHPQRKDTTPNVTGVASGVRSVVAWRKTVTINEEQGDVFPRWKDTTPNDTLWVAFGVRSVVAMATTSTWRSSR